MEVQGQPSSQRQSSPTIPAAAHWDEADFMTATDVLPVRVPLERVEIGRWKYVGTDLSDLELLYELESSNLCIRCNVRGLNGSKPPATFRVLDISAADLSLATVIPGSLESMVARLVLETEEHIECTVHESQDSSGAGEKHPDTYQNVHGSKGGQSETTIPHQKGNGGSSCSENEREPQVKEIHSRMVVMTASVHEAGHLRDILLFLKGGYMGKVSPDAMFLNPKATTKENDMPDTASLSSDQSLLPNSVNGITFLETLPVWARYVPWWVYSRNVRISIQNILFFYSLFSIVWALWQLYRNVDVIQHVLEPIIAVLKEVYLASVIEVFDWILASFTEFWMRFLSPLNILQALLLTPLLQALIQLKTIFLPLCQVLYSILLTVWRCLPNTQLLTVIRSLCVGLYGIVGVLGQSLWVLVSYLAKPVHIIWQGFLNSRIAVGSLDLNRLKLSWVINLTISSIRAIGNGVAKLCGYTSRRRKLLKVKRQYMSPVRHMRSPVHPRTPVYYSSPLTKDVS